MADFNAAFEPMLKHEGYPGYVNNPHDHGGETFAGIARKFWPGWKGWEIVDKLKPDAKKLAADPSLLSLTKDFYRRNFWYPRMDEIASQPVADWLFDKQVNMGIRQAVRLLQRALDLPDDGKFGPITLKHVNAADPKELVAKCRGEARTFYLALAEKDPTQKQFLKGWLNRA